MLAVENEFGL